MSRFLEYINIKFFYLCHDGFLLSSVSSGNGFSFSISIALVCVFAALFRFFLLLRHFLSRTVFTVLLSFLVSYLYSRLFHFSLLFASLFLIFLWSTEWRYDCS